MSSTLPIGGDVFSVHIGMRSIECQIAYSFSSFWDVNGRDTMKGCMVLSEFDAFVQQHVVF